MQTYQNGTFQRRIAHKKNDKIHCIVDEWKDGKIVKSWTYYRIDVAWGIQDFKKYNIKVVENMYYHTIYTSELKLIYSSND